MYSVPVINLKSNATDYTTIIILIHLNWSSKADIEFLLNLMKI